MRLLFIIIVGINIVPLFAKATSYLAQNCKQEGFACGECETKTQTELSDLIAKLAGVQRPAGSHWSELKLNSTNSIVSVDGVRPTVESVLTQIADIMKRNNPFGGNRLNPIIIGNSKSTQGTTPDNPRIALKSPDGELWVTYNTDPKAPGYNTIEIMRWNGRMGKYEFTELDFGSKENSRGHIDQTGQKCTRCHEQNLRANWDTYRAWANVVPPRDDLLEVVDSKNEMGEMGGPDINARTYLNFMKSVVKAKDSPESTRDKRLAILDPPGDVALTSAQRVEAIEQSLKSEKFYRVPHYPTAKNNKAYDSKTAEKAGSSHLGFDQLMGQQLCHISQQIKKSPNYEKFKYVMLGVMKCGASGSDTIYQEELEKYLPESFKKMATSYFKANPSQLQLAQGQVRVESGGVNPTLEAVFDHTKKIHGVGNSYKEERQIEFLITQATQIEGANSSQARAQADYIAKEKFSDVGSPYTAIKDPGGVKGVNEKSPGMIATFRYLLQPFGVAVDSWSMEIGKNVSDSSYSFSDQFEIMMEQGMWNKEWDLIPGSGTTEKCQKLQSLSKAALDSTSGLATTTTVPTISYCNGTEEDMSSRELTQKAQEVITTTCMSCHNGNAGPKFQFDFNDLAKTRNWLLSSELVRSGSTFQKILAALGKHHVLVGVKQMPPGGWSGQRATGEMDEDDVAQRNFLATYILSIVKKSNFNCSKVRAYSLPTAIHNREDSSLMKED